MSIDRGFKTITYHTNLRTNAEFDHPARLDHRFPYLWRDNIFCWPKEIVAALRNLQAKISNMYEARGDQSLHRLFTLSANDDSS